MEAYKPTEREVELAREQDCKWREKEKMARPIPQTPVPEILQKAFPEGGRKDDEDKVRWDLLPPDALDEIAKVLTFGAVKYGDRNWEKGMAWHRPFGALMRHMWDWWRGAPPDPDTGLSHLAHAGCCLLFLLSYELRGIGKDDRHKL